MRKNAAVYVCGVYSITCKRSGYVYFGSSVNVRQRMNGYRNSLEIGKCHNKALQYAFDLFGIDNLVFSLVEETTVELVRERELHYIHSHPGKTFNILRDSRCIPKVSEATRLKLSARAKNQHAKGNLGRSTWRS